MRHPIPLLQVARVDLAHACYNLIDMVYERRDLMAKEERALAVLQRSAFAFPRVDEELETELLHCRYDLTLINRAIKAQQRELGANDVVEAFIVYKVRDLRCRERSGAWEANGTLKYR